MYTPFWAPGKAWTSAPPTIRTVSAFAVAEPYNAKIPNPTAAVSPLRPARIIAVFTGPLQSAPMDAPTAIQPDFAELDFSPRSFSACGHVG